jgi:hypothetical protein
MRRPSLLLLLLLLPDACIDRFDFTPTESTNQWVIDGSITDAPGPYTVKISKTRKLVDFSPPPAVSVKSVTLFDSDGNNEALIEKTPGVYQTSVTGIRGTIGKSYFIKIETFDGKIFESIPEKIEPAGSVDSIYYEFEKQTSEDNLVSYLFKIKMDSRGDANTENYFLWKLTGVYRVITSPELHIYFEKTPGGTIIIKDPRPCSGTILNTQTNALSQIRPCECCECWANLVDVTPKVSNNQINTNNTFKGIEVGSIPVEFWPFWDKTQVKVEQLSLSKNAFTFWKTIQDQQEGATSLFQPATGKIVSNIIHKNGNEQVQGIFFASSVATKSIFLTVKDIPLGRSVVPQPPGLPPRYIPRPNDPPDYIAEYYTEPFVVRESCLLAFKHSTTIKPADWK